MSVVIYSLFIIIIVVEIKGLLHNSESLQFAEWVCTVSVILRPDFKLTCVYVVRTLEKRITVILPLTSTCLSSGSFTNFKKVGVLKKGDDCSVLQLNENRFLKTGETPLKRWGSGSVSLSYDSDKVSLSSSTTPLRPHYWTSPLLCSLLPCVVL